MKGHHENKEQDSGSSAVDCRIVGANTQQNLVTNPPENAGIIAYQLPFPASTPYQSFYFSGPTPSGSFDRKTPSTPAKTRMADQ